LTEKLLEARALARLRIQVDVSRADATVFGGEHAIQTYSIGAAEMDARVPEVLQSACRTDGETSLIRGLVDPSLQRSDPFQAGRPCGAKCRDVDPRRCAIPVEVARGGGVVSIDDEDSTARQPSG